mmetsp:Transcript_45927/g.85399  ORF Transcript_45927/g.85399 Transcript_45927/m.85399 type:complete len:226 (+) Transcript_45927:126-803(+)
MFISENGTHLLKGANDGEVSDHVDLAKLLMDHEAKDAHHGSTAVVELDGTLGELCLLVKGVPAEVKGAVAEVTRELSGLGTVGRVLHHKQLQEPNEGKNLEHASLRDGAVAEDSGDAVGVRVKGVAGHVNVAREVDTIAGRDLTKESELTDAAVLDLDVTEAVEALLVGISEHAKRIEESERGLGTKLALEGVEGGGSLANLGGGEGGGRASEEGSNGELHFELI